MRKIFFEKLKKLAREDKNIFILGADLGLKYFADLKEEDPKRFLNAGIAEVNMVGTASGLAMSGKNVYCYSIIPFIAMRAFEQIRLNLCQSNLNVKLLGAGGGLVYGLEGITHHAIEDIAIMRALPNMAVVAPGDVKEAELLAEQSVNHIGPLYIRFGKDVAESVYEGEIDFKIGKGNIIKEGDDICLITTGSMLCTGKVVCDLLKEKGVNTGLISMHTIKPLDEDLVKDCAGKYKSIFTLEDHNVIGGLGSAVAEVLLENGFKGVFKRIGVPDKYSSDIGKEGYLMEKMGLDPESIKNLILKYNG